MLDKTASKFSLLSGAKFEIMIYLGVLMVASLRIGRSLLMQVEFIWKFYC